jgi:hypothetical protein
MIYGIISFIVSAACLAIFMRLRTAKKLSVLDARIAATAASVRISFFLCLCAVPFLSFISMILNSVAWANYAEAAVIVEGAATFLIGLMALLQRYGALFFKMTPAMERNEVLVLLIMPVVLYLSYLPSTILVLYYIGPGLYSLYLLWSLLYKPAKK